MQELEKETNGNNKNICEYLLKSFFILKIVVVLTKNKSHENNRTTENNSRPPS